LCCNSSGRRGGPASRRPRRAGSGRGAIVRQLAVLALLILVGAGAVPSSRIAAAADAAIEVLVAMSPPTTRLEDGRPVGYWVELIGLAASRAEVAVGFQILPYARALREVSDGTNLCNPLVARTPDREETYSWIAPTRRLLISAFVLRGAADPPRTVEALKQREIAVMRGTLGDLTLATLGIPARRVADTERLALLLERGRVSVIVSDFQVAMAAASTAVIVIEEVVRLSETPGFFACSPRLDPAIGRRLAVEIDAIFATGEDRAIAAVNGLGDSYEVVRPAPRQ
jgi:polar amino acid transport system substrate-binding protein